MPESPSRPGHVRQRWWRRPTRLALLALAALLAAWYLVPLVRHIPAAEPMVVIAHRGSPSSSGAPENTLGAFRAAIDAGADWLEFDVRATRDGQLVVLHDATVDRTTDGSGAIAGLTLEQARALDAGNGERIPTVDEVVRLARAAGVPILPEIKDGPGQPASAPATPAAAAPEAVSASSRKETEKAVSSGKTTMVMKCNAASICDADGDDAYVADLARAAAPAPAEAVEAP